MHEMSVMEEVFTIIKNNIVKYNLTKITGVSIRVGDMTCLNDEALRFAFQIFSDNTIVEGARLNIKRVVARARCNNCGSVFEISYYDKLCPFCNTYSDQIVNGYELFLDEVEGETDEENSYKGQDT